MYLSIKKSFSLDQVFINRMAKMREVKPTKNPMPVSIIALGLIQIVKGISVLGDRLAFLISNPFPEVEDSFMHIVRFRIFSKEVSPESTFQKSSDLLPFR